MSLLQNIYPCRAFCVFRGGQTGPPASKGHGKSWLPAADSFARRGYSIYRGGHIRTPAAANRSGKTKKRKKAQTGLDPGRTEPRSRRRRRLDPPQLQPAAPPEGEEGPGWAPRPPDLRRRRLGGRETTPLRGSVPSRRVGAAPPWIRAVAAGWRCPTVDPRRTGHAAARHRAWRSTRHPLLATVVGDLQGCECERDKIHH